MAFNLRSKFTSNGLIKSVKTGATPLLQTECLQYGKDPNTGERICVTDKSSGKPGTVSRPRGEINKTFKNITPEQMAKVTAEGFTADLTGYAKYVKAYNSGNLPSQAVIRDRSTTDATSEVKYSGKPRKYNQDYVTHYKLEYSSETPTWQEQKDVFMNSERFKKLSDKNKDKQFKKFKRLFSDANGGITWTKGNGKKKIIKTNAPGTISDWKPRN